MKKAIGLVIVVLSFAVVASDAHADKGIRYECRTIRDELVLTLPILEDTGVVDVIFHGTVISALYMRTGLSQVWIFDAEEDSALYVELKPDLRAYYWDFRGAEEGETRTSESAFWCVKRK